MAGWKEVRAKTGEDKDGKAVVRQIGRVLETKNGPMLKLDTIPVNWDGWAYINDPKPREDARAAAPRRAPQDDDDPIPF